jgi:precorrin-2 dehydrogenase/sirohydrochlorin ferrochelatase
MLPLFLNLTDRLVLVVGGGPVGRRKAAAALAAGARVRLVCLEPRPAEPSDPHLDWRTEPYTAAHLEGASLVFAAAPALVNARVVAEARSRGLWVNAASEPAQGDFFLPATVRRGDLVLAIGTGGAAPALAQAIRRHLEEQFDETFAVWVELLEELRPLVLARIPDADERRAVLERLCRWGWLERLRHEERSAVRAAMLAEIVPGPESRSGFPA